MTAIDVAVAGGERTEARLPFGIKLIIALALTSLTAYALTAAQVYFMRHGAILDPELIGAPGRSSPLRSNIYSAARRGRTHAQLRGEDSLSDHEFDPAESGIGDQRGLAEQTGAAVL